MTTCEDIRFDVVGFDRQDEKSIKGGHYRMRCRCVISQIHFVLDYIIRKHCLNIEMAC